MRRRKRGKERGRKGVGGRDEAKGRRREGEKERRREEGGEEGRKDRQEGGRKLHLEGSLGKAGPWQDPSLGRR